MVITNSPYGDNSSGSSINDVTRRRGRGFTILWRCATYGEGEVKGRVTSRTSH